LKSWSKHSVQYFNIYLIGKNNLKLNIKHVFDDFSAKYEKLICWLDFKGTPQWDVIFVKNLEIE
jgi:hypothetical protein